MDCVICGNWFSSVIHDGACPTCSRAIKQLGLNMTPGRLLELSQAEKDGRLMVLPCKVGDTVYFPVSGRWNAAAIDQIEIGKDGIWFGWVQYDIGPEVNEIWSSGCFTKNDIGENVFLTREEAEAELKKREEADNEAD